MVKCNRRGSFNSRNEDEEELVKDLGKQGIGENASSNGKRGPPLKS